MPRRGKEFFDTATLLIALYVGVVLFLMWRGRGSLYFYSTILGLPVPLKYPLSDAIREGAMVGVLASILVYFNTLFSVRQRGAHGTLASLLNALIFFGVGGAPLYFRPDTSEAVFFGVFIAAGSIASVSTAWHLFLRFRQRQLKAEGLKLRHAKYLEFVRLLSTTAIVLITGAWVVTWAYWWSAQDPVIRSSPDWAMLLADQALTLFFILAGFFFGLIHPFIRELNRIEENMEGQQLPTSLRQSELK